MKKINIFITVIMLSFLMFQTSCVKKDYDNPPTNCNDVKLTATNTIMQVKSLLESGDTVKIKEDIIIEGTLISDDAGGNFYKELIIQDTSGGISLQIDDSKLYKKYKTGQKLYFKCKDLYVGKSKGVIKLGGMYTENGQTKFGRISREDSVLNKYIVKSCDISPAVPKVTTINEVISNDKLLYTLVKIENVQFRAIDTGSTWADAIGLQGKNNYIKNKNNDSIIVRTSGYAKFAGSKLPTGNGSITCVVAKYNTDYQLFIIKPSDVKFDKERFKLEIF